MPKVVKKATAAKSLKHDPLAQAILEETESAGLRKEPRKKVNRKGKIDDDDEDAVLPSKVTRRIMEVAQAQKADEDELDLEQMEDEAGGDAGSDIGDKDFEDDGADVDDEGFMMIDDLSNEDKEALKMFMPQSMGGGAPQKKSQTLADIILGKIQEHEARASGQSTGGLVVQEPGQAPGGLTQKHVQVYTEIGKWLGYYKEGKLPKAFKIIPNLENWEEVLELTDPLKWSPAAMYQAVYIFSSNLNPRMAQRFYNLVLLPAVREDIARHQRVNFHHYRALRRALFKPAAFFKGILLPLCQENCTIKEATILCSVMAKASIPPLHVAAAIAKLSDLTPWYGTTSLFLASLINKKYALPLRVIESIVAHNCSFAGDKSVLPLIWHRSLLVFLQRYKNDLTSDQTRRLKELLRVHFHDGIGPECRRELQAAMIKPGAAPSAMDTR